MSQKTVYELEGVVSIEEKGFGSKAKKILNTIRDITTSFETMARKDAGLIKLSKRGQQLQEKYEEARKKVETLAEALQRLEEIGAPEEDIEAMSQALREAIQEAQDLDDVINHSRNYGKHGLFEEAGPASFIADMRAYAARAKSIGGEIFGSLGSGISKALSANPFGRILVGLNNLRKKVADAGYLVKHYAKGMWNNLKTAGSKIVGVCKKIAGGFSKIVHGSNSASSSMKGLGRRLFALAAAFISTYIGMNALKDGMNNLIAYDARTASSVNTLKGALDTLKNAMATAFAPVLNAIVPILSTLIDWLVAACTAIAHFVAALTGQSQVTIARKSIGGVGSAASGAAGSLGDAADAAEEYKRTLMGFDQINKLDDPTSGSGGSGGGGGGGGAGGSGSMFETVPVDSTISEWADKIKEAWNNADFTEIGAILGTKLNEALESIDWELIKATSAKIAKSIATFLNGFIETVDWNLVGKTFAEGINTIIEFGYSFVTNFHWDSFGQAIGNSINGFVTNLDLAKAAQTLSGALKGILDTAINALETIDFHAIGDKIGEFITNIDYIGLGKKFIILLKDAVIGAFNLLDGIFDSIGTKLGELMDEGVAALGDWAGSTVKVGISLVKSGWTTLTNFVGNAVSAAVSLVKSGWSSLKAFVGDSVKAAVSLAKSGWSSLKGFVGSSVSVGISLFKSGWKSISAFVGTKVKVGISLVKSGWKSLKKFFGLSEGGWYSGHGWKAFSGGAIQSGGGWKPITAAAGGGGFGQGQMFIAREAGPELVGQIGSHTAVMNNDQIVASVAAGVAQAVASVMNGRGNSVSVYLEGDAGQFFKVMQSKANDYTRSTGQPAFPV